MSISSYITLEKELFVVIYSITTLERKIFMEELMALAGRPSQG